MPREQPRRRLADLRDAERIDEPVERDAPPLIDRPDQIAGAQLTPAFAAHQLLRLEPEDIAGAADEAVSPERGDMLRAHSLDIETVARDKMLQSFDRLRGADQTSSAALRDKAGLANDETAASGTFVRKLVRRRIGRPLIQDDRDNLRDHVTGALDDDRIALADVLTLDLVFVMQRCPLHDDTAHGDRREKRHRS